MMNTYPPHEATMQKQLKAQHAEMKRDPVFTDLTHKQNVKIKAKIATASLSYEPPTEREMYEGTNPTKADARRAVLVRRVAS